MTDQSDLIKLYSTRILALAAEMPLVGRLDAPDGTAMKRSPLCGAKVTVDVNMSGGKICDFAQDVKACALGQAAASITAAQIIGLGVEDIEAARDSLNLMLKQDGPPPAAPFDEFEVLQPAKDFKNRHASILLALDATLAACQDADAKIP